LPAPDKKSKPPPIIYHRKARPKRAPPTLDFEHVLANAFMAPPKRKKPQSFMEDEEDDDDFIDEEDDDDVNEEDSSTTVTEFDQKKFMQLLNNKDVQKMIEVLN
jgi:hypothetical protein